MEPSTPLSETPSPAPDRPAASAPAAHPSDWPARVTGVRHGVEVVAIAAAALYFGYQLLDGWRRTNLDVTLRTERAPMIAAEGGPADRDHLAIFADLVKGANGSVRFGLAQARVTCPTHPAAAPIVVNLADGRRVAYDGDSLRWERYSDRDYHISAGERLQLAGLVTVPRAAACVVTAVVSAPDDFPGSSAADHQWRATTVSLPRAAREDAIARDVPAPRAERRRVQ